MADGGERCEWAVTGTDCAACANQIRDAVGRLPGVSEVSVTLMSERLKLTRAQDCARCERIEAVVAALGYGLGERPKAPAARGSVLPGAEGQDHEGHDHGEHEGHDHGDHDHDHGEHEGHDHAGHDHAAQDHAAPAGGHLHDDPAERGRRWYQTAKGRLVIGTGLLLAAASVVEALAPGRIGFWAFVRACLIGVAPVARRALAALRFGQPFTVESLMPLAATGALVIGAAEEAALVVFLFAVAEVLEGVAANKARGGIRALASLAPKTALLETEGTAREVPAESLQPGKTVLVRPGDRIPADGVIVRGTSGIDESPATGKDRPAAVVRARRSLPARSTPRPRCASA